ncbi:hypothetical protein [Mycobacterium deserti]|uniref:PQQ-binding-like beta-propeller repeat protein n=1 Tax=Mycobacterium deserti TaxID=2978347 RepID=A0ABT2MAI0_9MYCO|nr:hypothetical protein [Mycobacterium deserti]MCT7658599.1 hypothetical protein [Mycobacterium deserti]
MVDDHGADVDSDRQSFPQFAPLLGVVFGLLLAATGTLVYAWLAREPANPLVADRSSVTAMLQRTTLAVALSGLMVALYLVVGRVHRRGTGRRARVVTFSSPVLLAVSVAGLVLLVKGGTARVFETAGRAQMGFDAIAVTTVARAAWWLACLAVFALFLLSASAYIFPESQTPGDPKGRPNHPVIACATAALVSVIVITAVAVVANRPSSDNPTAERVDAPPVPAVTGAVAYGFDAPIGTEQLMPAGAGFVRRFNGSTPKTNYRLEGFDGVTGQSRWSFQMPGLSMYSARSTGTGPDSVVVADGYVAMGRDGSSVLIGIDATTGAPLWTRTDVGTFGAEDVVTGASSRVVLAVQSVEDAEGLTVNRTWTALEPRTGHTMWTRTFDGKCAGYARLTDDAVLQHNCGTPGNVIATVIDTETGTDRGTITASDLGVDPRSPAAREGMRLSGAEGGIAVVQGSATSDSADMVVDIDTQTLRRRLPQEYSAALIDGQSVALYRRTGNVNTPSSLAIFDLDSNRIIETPLLSANLGYIGGEAQWRPIVRAGSLWATFLPDVPTAQQLEETRRIALPLRTIDSTGATRTLPDPCPPPDSHAHYLAAVPGTLLTYCGWAVVGVR